MQIKRFTSEKYELLLLSALSFFLMREKDLKIGIRYLQCLFYRAILFVSHFKRPSKVSEKH